MITHRGVNGRVGWPSSSVVGSNFPWSAHPTFRGRHPTFHGRHSSLRGRHSTFSVVGTQLSMVGIQLSAVGIHPSVVGIQLSVVGIRSTRSAFVPPWSALVPRSAFVPTVGIQLSSGRHSTFQFAVCGRRMRFLEWWHQVWFRWDASLQGNGSIVSFKIQEPVFASMAAKVRRCQLPPPLWIDVIEGWLGARPSVFSKMATARRMSRAASG